MAPPPLTSRSAERMKDVVGRVDTLVDGGMAPDQAIAKAASDLAMPVGHVPLVVRAFNTGRAVRQLGADDPWEKAAAHPVASIDGVVAELTKKPETVKASFDHHYAKPPVRPTPTLPPRQQTKAATVVEKDAAAVVEPARRRKDDSWDLEVKAATAFEEAVEIALSLRPSQYLAAKRAATALNPDAAEFFFGTVESYRDDPELGIAVPYHAGIRKLAASKEEFDPTLRNDHPLVRAIVAIGEVKQAYVPSPADEAPDGYEIVRAAGNIKFLRKQATCPVFGTVLQPVKAASAPAEPRPVWDFDTPDPEKAARVAEGLNSVSRGIGDFFGSEGQSAFGRGFRGFPFSVAGAIAKNPVTSRAVDFAPEDDKSVRDRAVGSLPDDMKRVDYQAAAQAMLADPRFAKADPKIILDTYRDLHSLAPMSMANTGIASDLINRRLQTGPLNYFDLEKLTTIEKNLAAVRRDSRPIEDD